MHCHIDSHLSIGLAMVFAVEDGPTPDTKLPPPPPDLPRCWGPEAVRVCRVRFSRNNVPDEKKTSCILRWFDFAIVWGWLKCKLHPITHVFCSIFFYNPKNVIPGWFWTCIFFLISESVSVAGPFHLKPLHVLFSRRISAFYSIPIWSFIFSLYVAWGVSQANFFSAVTRFRCKQRVVLWFSKSCVGITFLLLPLQYIFKVLVDDEQSDKEDHQKTIRCNFILFISSCAKLFFFCTTNYLS